MVSLDILPIAVAIFFDERLGPMTILSFIVFSYCVCLGVVAFFILTSEEKHWQKILAVLILFVLPILGPALLFQAYVLDVRSAKKEEQAKKEREKLLEAEEQRRIQNAAKMLHDELGASLKDALESIDGLSNLLKSAHISLLLASREYELRAFGPFWDAIEDAMLHLGLFNGNIRKLNTLSVEYGRKRPGDSNVLPPTLYASETIPDPRTVLDEFQSVVRRAQTDFEFSLIWEQRKTQQAIVAGFRTMGEALLNLRVSVEEGFFDTIKSISVMAVEIQSVGEFKAKIMNTKGDVIAHIEYE